jgi:hypothetical protein
MTWALARRQLVAIGEGVAPTTRLGGLPAKFRHDKNGDENADTGDSRRFWLRTLSGYGRGPFTTQTTWWRATVQLVVEYVADSKTDALDESMVSDAIDLIKAYSLGSNWDRPTSGIVSVSAAGDSIAPFEIESGDGRRRLRINLEVTYHD